jgi:FAD/FMN-containing dehydrogenase
MTIEALRSSISGTLLVDGDEGFSALPFAVGAPSVIVRPQSTDDVAAALAHATAEGLAVSIRSGGHTGGSHTTVAGGLVLDLSAFSSILVEGSTVTIGAGATWGAVAAELAQHDLALSSGDTASVGVGGLTLGGGVGWLVRQYGLALDSLRSARVVLANGSVVTASDSENPDLFWAIRGGGGNFGVVTHFTFEAHPLDGIVHGVIAVSTDDLGALLRGYRDVMRHAPEALGVSFMKFPPMGPDMPGGPAFHVLWAGSDLDEAMRHIQPLLDLPGVVSHDIAPKGYVDALDDPPPAEPGAPMPTIVGNNGWVRDFSDEAIDTIVETDAALAGSMLIVRYVRGAFNRIAEDATAFAWRDAEALVVSIAFLPPGTEPEAAARVNEAWAPVRAFTEGTYGNFVTEVGERIVSLMYPPPTRARLSSLKSVWDPANLFSQNQNIEPG